MLQGVRCPERGVRIFACAAVAHRQEQRGEHEAVDPRPEERDGPGGHHRHDALGNERYQTQTAGWTSHTHEIDDAERRAIEAAMERNAGQLEAVARELNVSTTTLWRKMKRLGMCKE